MLLTEFRPVPGFESTHEVNGLGVVWSKPRRITRANGTSMTLGGRFLKPTPDRRGYLYMNIQDGGRRRRWYVHQLVAAAFIGPRPGDLHVLHNNGRNQDNRPSNLRYDTNAENMRDRVRHGAHHYASRDHCSSGHEYTAESTRIRIRNGRESRVCLPCKRSNANMHRRLRQESPDILNELEKK